MMFEFYLPNGEKSHDVQKFVEEYGKKYYKKNKDTVAENKVDILLRAKTLCEEDNNENIFFILAWKIGGLDLRKTNDEEENPQKTIFYNNNKKWIWHKKNPQGTNFGSSIEPLDELISQVSKMSVEQQVNKWDKVSFASNPKVASRILKKLAELNTKQMGSVYLLTLLYFLTKGRWPIYDRFAYKAMVAIRDGKKPNEDTFGYEQKLPAKKGKNDNSFPRRLSQIVFEAKESFNDNQYREYVEFIIEFQKGLPQKLKYTSSRDLDRALWFYGHLFNKKKNKQKKHNKAKRDRVF